MRVQAIWDTLHDALLLPRCWAVQRGDEPRPDLIGMTAREGRRLLVYADQLTVHWAVTEPCDPHIEALAQAIAEWEPWRFGRLPLPRDPYMRSVTLSSPESAIVLRLITADSGVMGVGAIPAFTSMIRADVLVAKPAQRSRAA